MHCTFQTYVMQYKIEVMLSSACFTYESQLLSLTIVHLSKQCVSQNATSIISIVLQKRRDLCYCTATTNSRLAISSMTPTYTCHDTRKCNDSFSVGDLAVAILVGDFFIIVGWEC